MTINELNAEWARYCSIGTTNVNSFEDVATFWRAWYVMGLCSPAASPLRCILRGGPLAEVVAPCLWCPVASAAVERSFSLAGLIHAKNRQQMGKGLREGAVTMFCSGDVQGRFHTP